MAFFRTIRKSRSEKICKVLNTAGVTSFSMGGAGLFYVDGPGVVGGRFTILDNGNVGIGKSNPTTKLYVEGNLTSSATIFGSTLEQILERDIKQVLLLNVE